jgi:hypothetical protein
VAQSTPPEPPLVLVGLLLKLMQVTRQVLDTRTSTGAGGCPAEADAGHSSSPGSAAGWCPVVGLSTYGLGQSASKLAFASSVAPAYLAQVKHQVSWPLLAPWMQAYCQALGLLWLL